ncbi:MAG TPA: VIT1/CCC1 transporter family protein [Povalibacter sp.]|nr:VIT1/CCC1 transporter family protein [Povalibacter sp.]
MTRTHSSLMDRYLDPASSMGEVLFGLIMTLTFTLGAGIIIQDEGREGARQLLIAVIGCNIAWGIIDAALYLAGQIFDRGRLRRLGRAIRESRDPASATQLVASELDPLLSDVLSPAETSVLYSRIASNVAARPERYTRLTKEDWLGALVSFFLVVLTSVPAALPFMFIHEAHLALRVSNAILLALLFMCGFWWARYTLGRPWLVGAVFLVCGLILVAAAIALGG